MGGTQLYSFSDSGLSASGPSLAVVPFPLCSSTAESVVAQYGSNLKNDHFAYIRICAISRQHGEPPLLLAICRCAAGGGRRHLLLPRISVLLVEQLQQSCRLLLLEYVGRTPSLGNAASFEHHLGSGRGLKTLREKRLPQILSVPLTSTQQSNIQPSTCVTSGPDRFDYTYSYCSSLVSETTLTSGITAY